MKALPFLATIAVLIFSCISENEVRQPMAENVENALHYNWPSKEVHDSLLIADMEDITLWSASGMGSFELTSERSIDGETSIRMIFPFYDTAWIRMNAERNGTYDGTNSYNNRVSVNLPEPQDWSDFNRISFWIYVPEEARPVKDNFCLMFNCDDISTSPLITPRAMHCLHHLEAGKWNKVLWEIQEIPRHKVTSFTFRFSAIGDGYRSDGTAMFDIDHMVLEKVDVDRHEGWATMPGKISFCHTGYLPEDPKLAVTSDPDVESFRLINEKGKIVLEKPVITENNKRGNYKILDFSEVQTEGTYTLEAGNIETRTFRIGNDVWRSPVEKALNFFFAERCGYHVPGIHDVCHQDWQAHHDGDTSIINGGWHDAGDMCQGAQQTGLSIYGMLELADQLQKRGNDPGLYELTKEEALWGMEWWLKTAFADGYRMQWSVMRHYTDNKIGTIDDVITRARFSPWIALLSAGIQSRAYMVFLDEVPEIAEKWKDAAIKDWNAAITALPQNQEDYPQSDGPGGDVLVLASWGAVSSAHLYKITGESKYAEKAIMFGKMVNDCQETSFREGIPITGYFYTSPAKERLVHNSHFAFEESPLAAFMTLCETFPNHKDWINWYAGVALYSEYFLKKGAEYSSPFKMLPASIYTRTEIESSNNINSFGLAMGTNFTEDVRETMLRQLEEGDKLSDNYYLRKFPIQIHNQFHGSTAIHLSEAAALAMAYKLRNDPAGEALATKQMEWTLGANPFSQSLMYGEGYDYTNLYAAASGNIVGALPVGMDCMSDDAPHWYNSNHMNPKEIWVVPTGRFLWGMAYVGIPALVKGNIKGFFEEEFELLNKETGESFTVETDEDGDFSKVMDAGKYAIRIDSVEMNVNTVKGGTYDLILDPENYMQITLEDVTVNDDNVSLKFGVYGKGEGVLTLKAYNGILSQDKISLDLTEDLQEFINVDMSIPDKDKPWIAIAYDEDNPSQQLEVLAKQSNSK